MINGILSLRGTSSPKKEASSANLSRTLRKISAKYIPEINFSNIWKRKVKFMNQMTHVLTMEHKIATLVDIGALNCIIQDFKAIVI